MGFSVQKRTENELSFQMEWYKRKALWLCYIKRAVLFSVVAIWQPSRHNVWTTAGYSGSSTLPRALAKHEKSVIHIQSQISLNSFGHSRIDMVLDGQCLVLARKQEKTEKS